MDAGVAGALAIAIAPNSTSGELAGLARPDRGYHKSASAKRAFLNHSGHPRGHWRRCRRASWRPGRRPWRPARLKAPGPAHRTTRPRARAARRRPPAGRTTAAAMRTYARCTTSTKSTPATRARDACGDRTAAELDLDQQRAGRRRARPTSLRGWSHRDWSIEPQLADDVGRANISRALVHFEDLDEPGSKGLE